MVGRVPSPPPPPPPPLLFSPQTPSLSTELFGISIMSKLKLSHSHSPQHRFVPIVFREKERGSPCTEVIRMRFTFIFGPANLPLLPLSLARFCFFLSYFPAHLSCLLVPNQEEFDAQSLSAYLDPLYLPAWRSSRFLRRGKEPQCGPIGRFWWFIQRALFSDGFLGENKALTPCTRCTF